MCCVRPTWETLKGFSNDDLIGKRLGAQDTHVSINAGNGITNRFPGSRKPSKLEDSMFKAFFEALRAALVWFGKEMSADTGYTPPRRRRPAPLPGHNYEDDNHHHDHAYDASAFSGGDGGGDGD